MSSKLRSSWWAVMGMVAGGLLLSTMIGCGGGAPATLSGTVKFAGEPVADGSIRLTPNEGTPGTGGTGKITDGKYSITSDGLKAGSHSVVIFAFRNTGRMVEAAGAEPESVGVEEGEEGGEGGEGGAAKPVMEEEQEQYIPNQYNRNTTLTVDLKPGENTHDFDLQP